MLILDDLEQLAFERREHRPELMPALQDMATLAYQRPHALTIAQCRTLLDAIFGALGCPSERSENRGLTAKLDRIIAPVPRRDHPAVKIEDAGEFNAIETDLGSPRGRRKRGDAGCHAVSRFLGDVLASRTSISSARRPRRTSTSHFNNSSCWVCGSKRSEQGVPYGTKPF